MGTGRRQKPLKLTEPPPPQPGDGSDDGGSKPVSAVQKGCPEAANDLMFTCSAAPGAPLYLLARRRTRTEPTSHWLR